MNTSYSKIRHIQESNRLLERRLLNEQSTKLDCNYFMTKKTGELVFDGGVSFKEVDGINVSNQSLPFVLGPGFGRQEYIGKYKYTYKFGPTLRNFKGEHHLECFTPDNKSAIIYLNCANTSDVKDNNQEMKTVLNKVSSEGIKVTPEMISSNPFKGVWNYKMISGVFDEVNYQWDLSGILFQTPNSDVSGNIITGNHSDLNYFKDTYKIDISDASPKGTFIVGFKYEDKDMGFIIYLSNNGYKKVGFSK